MIEFKTAFTRRELLWFGPLFAMFAAMVGSIVARRFDAPQVAHWIWVVAAAVITTFYLAPPLRRPIFMAWLASVFPIGWLLSHVLLSAVFYLAVLPVGLLLRLCGRDPLSRRPDPDARSYWIRREPRNDTRQYFKQF